MKADIRLTYGNLPSSPNHDVQLGFNFTALSRTSAAGLLNHSSTTAPGRAQAGYINSVSSEQHERQ